MMMVLEVVTIFLVAFAVSMALAHALEHPGKQRLDEKTDMAVQTIYYPGFTLGGIGEEFFTTEDTEGHRERRKSLRHFLLASSVFSVPSVVITSLLSTPFAT
jgi:hypothetical protein